MEKHVYVDKQVMNFVTA